MRLFAGVMLSLLVSFMVAGQARAQEDSSVFLRGWILSQTDALYEVCKENGYAIDNYMKAFNEVNQKEIQKSDAQMNAFPPETKKMMEQTLQAMLPQLKEQVKSQLDFAVKAAQVDGVETSIVEVCRKTDANPYEVIRRNNAARQEMNTMD